MKPHTYRIGRRLVAVILIGGSLTLLTLTIGVLMGSVTLDPIAVLKTLANQQVDPLTHSIVINLRLPRVLTAFAVGALLALAGLTMQVLLRNPLADPYILGLSGGAALAALWTLLLGSSALWVAGAAFTGALVSSGLVLAVAWLSHRAQPLRLLLTGVVLSAGWGALIVATLALAEPERLPSLLFWLMGDLSVTPLPALAGPTLFIVAVLTLLGGLLGRSLNLLAAGLERAALLGVPVDATRIALHLMAAIMAALAVALAGPIGFVGLIIPHALRLTIGADHRILVPASALAGGSFLVLADTLARTAFAPERLPVGVVTALIGVPIFLWLLARKPDRPSRPTDRKNVSKPTRSKAAGSLGGSLNRTIEKDEARKERLVNGATNAATGDGQPAHRCSSPPGLLHPPDLSSTAIVADTPHRTAGEWSQSQGDNPQSTRVTLDIDDVKLELPDGRELRWNEQLTGGQCWVLLGANGAGKSTWLKTLAGLQKPASGQILLDHKALSLWSRRLRAQRIGMLAQTPEFDLHTTVIEAAVQGRHPHRSIFELDSEHDYAEALTALSKVGLDRLGDRRVQALSGGEQQRLAIATLCVQNPAIWLLDEPTNHLDWQQRTLWQQLVKHHLHRGGLVVMSLHDVNVAAQLATHVMLLFDDGQSCTGPVDQQLVPAALERVYHQPIDVFEREGRRIILPKTEALTETER
ncbi:MAG: iron chelate uptake ABC transporter family permease subunit [Thioalkalivibrionaceae bacterium]